ncbi:MAG TPA: thiol:disulfide interchange protein DsbA/DsbL [Burkholderiales bacterium]
MRTMPALLLSLALLTPALAQAQARTAYTELKPPLQVETEGKIEVLEFFWYGCIHCYNLEPVLEPWLKKLPPDAQFRRVPAIFNERWAHDAAIFYSFEALGVLNRLHRPFFDAIHRDRLRTDDPKALDEWLQRQGVDPKKFAETMKSFGVQSRLRRAAVMTQAYKVDGTPSMAVHGRYTVGADQNPSREAMLETVSSLVDQIRKNK